MPLRAKGGAVIGLLVVMDTKPLQQIDNLQSLLGVLAPRIAVELERRRAEQERPQALADLHNVMETVPDIMLGLRVAVDRASALTMTHCLFARSSGGWYSSEVFSGRHRARGTEVRSHSPKPRARCHLFLSSMTKTKSEN